MFCFFRDKVKTVIVETFAGPADKGLFSASVQNTLYLAEKGALAQIPQVRFGAGHQNYQCQVGTFGQY